jgi:Ni/Co efflux regulator RcnB
LKKFVLLASVVAIVVAALALPAMASERWDNNDWWKDHDDNKNSWWDNNDWWKDHHDDDDDRDRFDRFFDRDFDRFFDRDFDRDFGGGGEVDQSFEQEAESGDVDQSFTVTNSGDNSNQCAGVQGVANTGNAQNQISVLQNGSEADDFSFEDSGSSIEVNPNNYTSCDQEVNQAASAYYGGKW